MCEHELWIDTIQLELGTINAIFICVPEIKQLAIKIENEYGFVIRSMRTDYPPVLWKPTCDQVESLLKKTFLDRNFQLVVMNHPKNPLHNLHTKHVLIPERLKADNTIEWIGELIFTDWWEIDL
jgi:hypothetical protein